MFLVRHMRTPASSPGVKLRKKKQMLERNTFTLMRFILAVLPVEVNVKTHTYTALFLP